MTFSKISGLPVSRSHAEDEALSQALPSDTEFWRKSSDTNLRYADEHLEDRVILSERMTRAVAALEADRPTIALRTLKEPFYYFTEDCNAWDSASEDERRAGIEACLRSSAGLPEPQVVEPVDGEL